MFGSRESAGVTLVEAEFAFVFVLIRFWRGVTEVQSR